MKKTYEAPQLEVLEVVVEKGFAVSEIDGVIDGMTYGDYNW